MMAHYEPSSPPLPLSFSWDRMPYVTMVRDGVTPSSIPAFNDVHHNFIVANYAADGGCLDNDDGSAWYRSVSFLRGRRSARS